MQIMKLFVSSKKVSVCLNIAISACLLLSKVQFTYQHFANA